MLRWPGWNKSTRRQRGLLLASSGGSGFTIPSPPATSTSSVVPYSPTLVTSFTGKDPYRPWRGVILDGIPFFANGWDQPWRWDVNTATAYSMGSTAPTSFVLADAAGGTTFPINTVLVYYLVFYNSTIGKETAPQLTAGTYGVTHTMTATKDALITWTDPGGEFDKARIFRRLQNSDNYKLVATVTASTATYTDSSTDASLATATDYDGTDHGPTYRTTLPPIFQGIAVHQNRLFGWQRDEALLYYAQTARVSGAPFPDDFPSANIWPVAPNDGMGGIVAVVSHYSSMYVFKRRACYEIVGDGPLTWTTRPMFKDRGALSPAALVELEGYMVFLDERGVFLWSPGGEPAVAGAAGGTKESPLAPIWTRLNLSAADTFHAVHDERNRLIKFYVALDYDPVPLYRIVYDYGANRFISVDRLLQRGASGILADAGGVEHEIAICDLGYVWESNVGESDGVFAGDNTATLTAATKLLYTASAAAFSQSVTLGAAGTPMDHYETDGDVADENRVYDAPSTTTIQPLYWASATPAIGETIAIGVIPAVVQFPFFDFNVAAKKVVQDVYLEHGTGVSGSLRVDTATNDGSFSLQKEVSLATSVRTVVPCDDRGYNWSLQLSQRYANLGFVVRGVEVRYFSRPDRGAA